MGIIRANKICRSTVAGFDTVYWDYAASTSFTTRATTTHHPTTKILPREIPSGDHMYLCSEAGDPWPCAEYHPPSTQLPANGAVTYHFCVFHHDSITDHECGGGFVITYAGAVAPTTGT